MPKHTIDFNVYDNRKPAGNIAGRAGRSSVNDTQVVQSISKNVNSVTLGVVKTLGSSLEKILNKILSDALRSNSSGRDSGVKATDIKRIARELSQGAVIDIVKALAKGSSGSKPTDVKSLEKILLIISDKLTKNVEKRTNIKLDQKDVFGALSKVIPKSTETAIRDLTSSTNALKAIVRDAISAYKTANSMRASGGKVDITEIGTVLSTIKKLMQDFRNLSTESKKAKDSLAAMADEASSSAKELYKSIDDAKKYVRNLAAESQTKAKEDPRAMASELISSVVGIIKKSDTLSSTKAGRAILTIDSKSGDLGKLAENLAELYSVLKKDLPSGWLGPQGLNKSIKELEKVVTSFENIPKQMGSDRLAAGWEGTAKSINNVLSKIGEAVTTIKLIVDDSSIKKTLSEHEYTISAKVEADTKSLEKDVYQKVKTALYKSSNIKISPSVNIGESQITGRSSSVKSKRGPSDFDIYKRDTITPQKGGFVERINSEGVKGMSPAARKIKVQAENNIKRLSASLYDLQNQIITSLDERFSKGGNKWAVSKPGGTKDPSKVFKLSPGDKQWTMEIANLNRLQKIMGDFGSSTDVLITNYKRKAINDRVSAAGNPVQIADLLGQWLKTVSIKQIESVEGIDDTTKNRLSQIKTSNSGIEVSAEMRNSIKSIFGEGEKLISVFKKTYGETEAKKQLQREGLVRTVAIPAARVSELGEASFQTSHGSQRALPKFAKFSTGFEVLYKALEDAGKAATARTFNSRIQGIGIRPEAHNRVDAEKLAEDMLEAVKSSIGSGAEAKSFVKGVYSTAAKGRGLELEAAGGPKAEEYEKKINEAISAFDSLSADKQVFPEFVKIMKQLNLSAYDVVKNLNKIEIQNVYDIMGQVLKGEGEGTKSPIGTLGTKPEYERSIRNFEKAIGEIEGVLPLIEGNRPRRGYHQENVVNMLTRGSSFYTATGDDKLGIDEQKKLIKDLNLELNDTLSRIEKTLGSDALPAGIKRITSLGIPESQAGRVEEYRTEGGTGSLNYLKTLNATSVKMYAEDLTSLAPFQQFQQAGRNISNVTNAMIDLTGSIDTPKLRSEKERALLESGRYGSKGYGYNVVAELRNTSSNFEDQIVISGKLAKAMTTAVSTLVKPAPKGRISGSTSEGLAMGTGITDIKEGEITKVAREYMKILGVPQSYEGRADKVLIEDVQKAISVVRGESVEVQQAKLAETFMNYFGRKLTTRYGSKGVSITPTGQTQGLADLVSQYGGKNIKVDPEATLGYQVAPKSVGALASELVGDALPDLKKDLIASGNKFIIDLFQDTDIVSKDEAEKTKKLYEDFSSSWQKVFSEPAPELGVGGISKIKSKYSSTLGKSEKDMFELKPIDVRISSYGAAKRGLQTEFLESIFSNLAGVGEGGVTTLKQLNQPSYERLLKKGGLSEYSSALGYTGSGKSASELEPELFKMFGGKGSLEEALGGKDQKNKDLALLAKRAAATEAASSYYSTVLDEFGSKNKAGEPRKGLVGEKFLQIVEEPHLNPAWKKGQIESGQKGARLNVPAFSAYSTVFGEQSELLKEVKSSLSTNAKKHWEYLKALQTIQDEDSQIYQNITKGLKSVDVSELESFDLSTGVHGKKYMNVAGEKVRNPRSFSDTILDIEKYPEAFNLKIPTGMYDEAGKTKKESLYVPGALARGTYPEPLIAGEHGMDELSRRLTHIVNMAKQLEEFMDSPGKVLEGDAVKKKIAPIVADWVDDSWNMARSGKPESEVEDYLQNMINKLSASLSDQVPSTALINTGGRSEKEYIFGNPLDPDKPGFYEKQMTKVAGGYTPPKYDHQMTRSEGMATVIGTMADLLVGKNSGTDVQKAAPSGLTRAIDAGEADTFAQGLGIDVLKETLDNRVSSLQRAKIDYYSTLADLSLGKGGSIDELFFSRKIPAVMGKAVTAVVDKRKDIDKFSNKLSLMERDYGENFSGQISQLGVVAEEHGKAIDNYQKIGVPILKQDEIGVPESFAKKIPLEFIKKFNVDKKNNLVAQSPEKVEGTLYDLLQFIKKLNAAPETASELGIPKYIQDELVPYIESIRFPFTGSSSISPFKPKLLKEGMYSDKSGRALEKNALVVPGIPEGIEGISKVIDDVQSRINSAMAEREELHKTGGAPEDIERLSLLIRELNSAISGIIPKYVAQAQKLDFDGDEIEIHSAKTAAARKDIEAHFKRFHETDSGGDIRTQDVFMKRFLAEGAQVKTTGPYVFGEAQQAFEKKFPAGKGFEFMKSPFLTKDLEYLSSREAMGVMHGGKDTGDISNVIKDVLSESNVASDTITAIMSKIDSMDKGNPDEYIDSIMRLFETGYTDLLSQLKSGIKKQLYEKKLGDTVEAQLFKIHTGPETEGMYRVHRLAESTAGFGGGLIGSEGKSSDYFKQRFPNVKALGGNPEEEFHTMVNEMLRFGIQKGMDVKHAGEKPVAGEMLSHLTRGPKGAEELWSKISGENKEKSFSDLNAFAEDSASAIRMRLGELPTSEIFEEARKVISSRGEDESQLDDSSREKLIKLMVDKLGFKGFLEEMSLLIRKEAVEGLVKQAEKWDDKKRRQPGRGLPPVSGNLEDWASMAVSGQMSKKGIDIKGDISEYQNPLYYKRTSSSYPKKEYDKYKARFGEIPISRDLQNLGDTEKDKFKRSKATAANILIDLNEFSTGGAKSGAYSDMISSTIDMLNEQQAEIEKYVTTLVKESYDPSAAKSINTAERVLSRKGVSSFANSVLNMKKGVSEEVDRLSDLAGVPALSDTELYDIQRNTSQIFSETKNIELKDLGLSKEKVESEVEDFVDNMVGKAQALRQLDRVTEALMSKRYEGRVLKDIFPSEGKATASSAYDAQREKSFNDLRERLKSSSGTGGGVGGSGRGGIPGIIGRGDGPIPVHIVSADSGVTINVRVLIGSGLTQNTERSPASQLEKVSEDLKSVIGDSGEIPNWVVPPDESMRTIISSYQGKRGATGTIVGRSEDSLKGRTGEVRDRAEAMATKSKFERLTPQDRDKYLTPPNIASGNDLESVFENLKTLHDQAKLYHKMRGVDDESLVGMPKEISSSIGSVPDEGPNYQAFIELTNKLKEIYESDPTALGGKKFTGKDFMIAWKLYRAAVGDYMINRAAQAEQEMGEFEKSGDTREANQSYGEFGRRVNRFQEFIKRGLGKRTDIYTDQKRFVYPGLAKASGVYMSPEDIHRKIGEPLGDDEKLISTFKGITKGLGNTKLTSPAASARNIFRELSDMQGSMAKILADGEKFGRLGPEILEAWDFDKLSSRATRLREALQQLLKESGELNAEQKKNIESIVKYLKSMEGMYSHMDLSGGVNKHGQTGIIPVPKFESPGVQEALHARNIQSTRAYFSKAAEAGGPKVGERFTYQEKVMGSAGETIKNVSHHFRKYGEAVLSSGSKIGVFSEKQQDLIEKMQRTGPTFANATRRVIMWGAASRLIYGGVAYLGRSLDELTNVETGIANLRMVMNPLQTDFGKMSKAATGLGKQYGVPVTEVLKSMKVFAQQGLAQEDVIDRTQTATLASNVTTLNAKEATEALTAAMKVFREEGQQSMRFLDAWSEVEAKHAITAEDMANAIKKSAAAAKTAGFTFDQLNGIVAAIGATTRQSGKEVGTSLRFIMRRLFSEEGPKTLAKLPSPITTITDSGELRSGFDILGDLAGQWKDLTSAQKLNIAQSVGGTRQYNALLVLMDQWDEALRGIRNSTNSKGSAERRNLEVMKTYAKQMEQAKAAATELKMELGKVILPTFKVGLKSLTYVIEAITAIPAPIKIATTGLLLMFGAFAKGVPIIDSIVDTISKGSSAFGEFGNSFAKQFDITKYEITGKGKKDDVFGLKTLTKIGDLEQGSKISDFHSSLGKILYITKEIGQSYNEMIGGMLVGTGKFGESVGETTKSVGDFLSISGSLITGGSVLKPKDILSGLQGKAAERGLGREGFKSAFKGGPKALGKLGGKILGFGGELVGMATSIVGEVVDTSSEYVGAAGHKVLKDFTTQNTGLVKSIAPLAVTVAALAPGLKVAYDEFKKLTSSAQDFEKSIDGIRRSNEDSLKSVRDLLQSYDTLSDKVKDIKKAGDPDVRKRRLELGTYEAPLVGMQKVQKDVTVLSNQLAESNLGLVVGYDKLGNAVLKSTGSFKSYLKELERLSTLKGIDTEISVLDKFITDLTETEGPEKFKVAIKELAESFPVIGDLIARNIKINPAKALELASDDLNKRINLKQKYPLSTAADIDIKRLQEVLGKARTAFQDSYSDFDRVYNTVISSSSLKGLDPKKIEQLLSSPVLRKAYELKLTVDPKFKLAPNVKAEDIMGKEILTALNPGLAGVLDVSKEFTAANLESAGIIKKEVGKSGIFDNIVDALGYGGSLDKNKVKVRSGDIVTLMDDGIVENYNIAGKQAIVKLKETTDGVFNWVVQYVNTKTLKLEERPLSSIEPLIENIFPADKIKEDLTYRMDALNTFVAGASAGLVGITAKDFKKDFNLGERFFSEIPTTTLLQGNFGFKPGTGYGPVPGAESFTKDIQNFYFKPMDELKTRLEQVEKLKLEGIETGDASISEDMYESINRLLTILKNNQVVLQFHAVFVDLMKEFSAGERILKQTLSITKRRFEVEKETSGLMKGVPKNIADYDTGVSKVNELTPRQMLLRSSAPARQMAGRLKTLSTISDDQLNRLDDIRKALVDTGSIRNLAKATGASLDKSKLGGFIEQVAKESDSSGPFKELTKINSKVETNTSDTVERLDKLLENQGDSETIKKQLSSLADLLGPGSFKNPQITANALERVAGLRKKAEKSGNQEMVMATNETLNQLTKRLITQVGFKEGEKLVGNRRSGNLFNNVFKDFTKEEFKQRAFSGIDPEVFIKKMEDAAPGKKNLFWFDKKSFGDSKELQKIRKLQEDDGKETIVTGKTLAKVQAAIAAASYLEKRGTNKVVDQLDDQIKQLDYQVVQARKEGKGEVSIRNLVKKQEALTIERGKAQKSADFYGTVASLSTAGVAASELAMAFGLTEKQVKALNIGAVGIYGAMKVASKIIGDELPDSAKKFEAEFKDVAKKMATGETPNRSDLGRLRDAGSALTKDVAAKTKEAFGKSSKDIVSEMSEASELALREGFDSQFKNPEAFDQAVKKFRDQGDTFEKYDDLLQKQRKEKTDLYKQQGGYRPDSKEFQDMTKKHNAEMFGWSRDISKKEAQKVIDAHPYSNIMAGDYGKEIRKQFSSELTDIGANAKAGAQVTGGPSRVQQAIAAYGAVALADYVGKKGADKTALSTTESKMEKQQGAIVAALEKNQEAAVKVINDIYKSQSEAEAAGKPSDVQTITKSLVQDTDAEYKKAVDMILEYEKIVVKAYEETAKEKARIQLKQLDDETRTADKAAVYSAVRSEKQRISSEAINRKYSLNNVIQKGLGNFAGEVTLPVSKDDLSTQQKIYSESSKKFKSMINAYADGPAVLDSMRRNMSNTSDRMLEEAEFINVTSDSEAVSKAKDRYDALKTSLEQQTEAADRYSQKLKDFANAYMYLNKFSEAMNSLQNSLREVNIQEAVDKFAGLRKLREDIDMFVGGSHPDALQSVSPEEERMGRMAGVKLTNLGSTRYEVEETKLKYQLRTATDGQQRSDIIQQLRDLPFKKERELALREQQRYDKAFIAGVSPYQDQMTLMQRVSATPDLKPELKSLVDNYMSELDKVISDASRVMTTTEYRDELKSNKSVVGKEAFGRINESIDALEKSGVYNVRRSVPEWDKVKFSQTMPKEIQEEFKKATMSTASGLELTANVSDPIVNKLDETNAILKAIADKEFGTSFDKPPGMFSSSKKDYVNLADYMTKKETQVSSNSGAESSKFSRLMDYLFKVENTPIKKYTGGNVIGPGTGTSDSIPAYLSDGEYVIKASSAQKIGIPKLAYMNSLGKIPGFATGGDVDEEKEKEDWAISVLNEVNSKLLNTKRERGKVDTETLPEDLKKQVSKSFMGLSAQYDTDMLRESLDKKRLFAIGSESRKRSIEFAKSEGRKEQSRSARLSNIIDGKPADYAILGLDSRRQLVNLDNDPVAYQSKYDLRSSKVDSSYDPSSMVSNVGKALPTMRPKYMDDAPYFMDKIYDRINRTNKLVAAGGLAGLTESEAKDVVQQKDRLDAIANTFASGKVNPLSSSFQKKALLALYGGTLKKGAKMLLSSETQFDDENRPDISGIVDLALGNILSGSEKFNKSALIGTVGTPQTASKTSGLMDYLFKLEDTPRSDFLKKRAAEKHPSASTGNEEKLKKELTSRITKPDDVDIVSLVSEILKNNSKNEVGPTQREIDFFSAMFNRSAIVKHNGGVIPRTGMVFAKGGEVILPTKFADGGEAISSSLNMPTIKLDTTIVDMLRELELKVEDTVLKVDTSNLPNIEVKQPDWKVEVADSDLPKISVEKPDWKVKLDDTSLPTISVEKPDWKINVDDASLPSVQVQQPDWSIGVDSTNLKDIEVKQPDWKVDVNMPTEDISVKVDVSSAADTLREAISSALRQTVTVEVTGQSNAAVGGERFDQMVDLIDKVNNKVLVIKNEFDDKIRMIGNNNQTIDIDRKVNSIVDTRFMVINKDVNDLKSEISNMGSSQRQKDSYYSAKMDDLDYRLKNALNITGIGTVGTGGFNI